MPNAKNFVGWDNFVEGIEVKMVAFMENVRKTEKKGWNKEISAYNDEPEPINNLTHAFQLMRI